MYHTSHTVSNIYSFIQKSQALRSCGVKENRINYDYFSRILSHCYYCYLMYHIFNKSLNTEFHHPNTIAFFSTKTKQNDKNNEYKN